MDSVVTGGLEIKTSYWLTADNEDCEDCDGFRPTGENWQLELLLRHAKSNRVCFRIFSLIKMVDCIIIQLNQQSELEIDSSELKDWHLRVIQDDGFIWRSKFEFVKRLHFGFSKTLVRYLTLTEKGIPPHLVFIFGDHRSDHNEDLSERDKRFWQYISLIQGIEKWCFRNAIVEGAFKVARWDRQNKSLLFIVPDVSDCQPIFNKLGERFHTRSHIKKTYVPFNGYDSWTVPEKLTPESLYETIYKKTKLGLKRDYSNFYYKQ